MPNRKSGRLPSFDYATPGAYFLTICAYHRRKLFARSAQGEQRLTPAGIVVESCWAQIPQHFPVELDAFVVMPNHVHGIIFLAGAGHAPPLPAVVGSFKSAATRGVNRLRPTGEGQTVWQRGYYERVVRDEHELEALRAYVVNNPAAWESDPENDLRTELPVSAPWL